MKHARRLVAALLSLASVSGPAAANSLNGAELRQLIVGKTLHLSAPFGSLPIRYHASGTMVARSKAMAVFSGVSEDRGSWRISGDRVCQRWKTWRAGKEQCFSVRLKGSTVHWTSNDGMSGTAVAAN